MPVSTLPIRLPAVLVPEAGEAFASWVDRVAADLDLAPGHAARVLGLESRPGSTMRPMFFGIALTNTGVRRIAAATGLEAGELHAMQLSSYDGGALDLTGLDLSFERSVQPVSLREWVSFDCSRACPKCLETAPVWPLWWRLGVAAVCPEHRLMLVDACPRCSVSLQRGNSGAQRGLMSRGGAFDLRKCNSRLPTAGRREALLCDQDLGDLPECAVPKSLAEAQQRVLNVVNGDLALVAGREVTTSEYFAALRYLVALARLSVTDEDLADLPPDVAEAFVADQRERRRALPGGSTAKLRASPPSAGHAAVALALVEPILSASDSSSCRELLEPWVVEAARQRREGGRGTVLRHIPQPSCLVPITSVSAPSAPRIVSRLATVASPQRLQARHIPHLINEADYGQLLADHLPGTAPVRGRRFASLALARLIGAVTWRQAAVDLDLDPAKAVQIAGAVVPRIKKADAFWRDVGLVGELLEAQGLIDYAKRRDTLAGLKTVPYTVQFAGLPPGYTFTPVRRRHGAAWAWQDLTGGDVHEAPAYQSGWWGNSKPASIRTGCYRFGARLPTTLRSALTAWGAALLHEKGCA